MDDPIYRKTAAGAEEVRLRQAGLDPRTRSLLILVNGELAASVLAQRLGDDTRVRLTRLQALGLIETPPAVVAAVDSAHVGSDPPAMRPSAPAPTRSGVALAQAAAAAAARVIPTRPAVEALMSVVMSRNRAEPDGATTPIDPDVAQAARLLPQDLEAARRRCVPLLMSHFGPDAPRVAAEALSAGDAATFARALVGVGEKLGVAMGRRRAEAVVAQIAHGH